MKVVVTGGAGYIGSVAVDHLLRGGHEVIVIDNLSQGYQEAVPQGATLHTLDIQNQAVVTQILQGADAILHFAAFIEAGESMKNPGKYFANNVGASLSLIEAAVAANVKHVVFSSTAAVYQSQDQPLKETDPIAPVNVYGQTKRMIEETLAWYSQLNHFNVSVLRYFNAAGATLLYDNAPRGEAHQPESHLIPNVLKTALGQKEKLTIFGTDYPTKDGTCVRDYIHVDDLVEAHLKALSALEKNQFSYEVFNLGNGEGFSNREVIETAQTVTGSDFLIEYGPRRKGDAPTLIANSQKAKEKLGWQPQYGLKEIISSAWNWHQSHPSGYKD